MSDRKSILLKAAYDLLKKQHTTGYVMNLLEETAHYDGTECDGFCLMEDIEIELDLRFGKRLPIKCTEQGCCYQGKPRVDSCECYKEK